MLPPHDYKPLSPPELKQAPVDGQPHKPSRPGRAPGAISSRDEITKHEHFPLLIGSCPHALRDAISELFVPHSLANIRLRSSLALWGIHPISRVHVTPRGRGTKSGCDWALQETSVRRASGEPVASLLIAGNPRGEHGMCSYSLRIPLVFRSYSPGLFLWPPARLPGGAAAPLVLVDGFGRPEIQTNLRCPMQPFRSVAARPRQKSPGCPQSTFFSVPSTCQFGRLNLARG